MNALQRGMQNVLTFKAKTLKKFMVLVVRAHYLCLECKFTVIYSLEWSIGGRNILEILQVTLFEITGIWNLLSASGHFPK